MLKFIAFDVEEGDAFLIEKDNKYILIDGGKDRGKKFPEKFKKTGLSELDLIVCTHADTDHAEGLIHLLQTDNQLSCKEIWIPAKWKRYIEDLKVNRNGFIRKLIHEIKSLESKEGLKEAFNNAVKNYDMSRNVETMNSDECNSDSESIYYCRSFEDKFVEIKADQFEIYFLSKLKSIEKQFDFYTTSHGGVVCLHLHGWAELTDNEFDVFREALDKYGKLEALIDVVKKKGIPIAWFDIVDKFLTEEDYVAYNEQGLLTPLCHYRIEEDNTISRSTALSDPILEMLPKYDPNKISLVLASKETDSNPLVIISSDSDFEKVDFIPRAENMLITVPHHGSKTNYEALNLCIQVSKGKNPTWIRGDSNRITMSDAFLGLKQNSDTYCTQCRKWNTDFQGGCITSNPQIISLVYDSGWHKQDGTKPIGCNCSRALKGEHNL